MAKKFYGRPRGPAFAEASACAQGYGARLRGRQLRVSNEAGDVIETQEQARDFKKLQFV